MSGQNAIIARMGIDLNGLKGDLTSAEKLAVRAANQMASELNRAAKGGGGGGGKGHGHGGGGNARIFGDPINAATGTTGNVSKIGMLSHLTGAAGPAAGLLLVAQTISGIAKAMMELEASTNEIRKVRGKGTQSWSDKLLPFNLQQGVQAGDAQATSVEGMRAQSDKLGKVASKPLEHGFMASLGAMIAPALVNPIVDKHEEEKRGALDDQLKISQKIAEATKYEAEAKEEAVHQSERQGELDLAQFEHTQRMAAIADRQAKGEKGEEGGILGPEAVALKKAEVESFERAKEAINLKHAAIAREIAMQNTLTFLREKGDDEGVQSAEERVRAAQAEVEAAAALTQEAQDKAAANLKSAQADLLLATRHRDVVRAEQQSQISIANMQVSADEKHLAALAAERKNLEEERAHADADRQKQIDVALAKNDESTRGAKSTLTSDAFGESNARIDAGQGVGQSEAQRAALGHIGEEEDRLKEMNRDREHYSDQDRAQQAAKIQGMRRAYDDVDHSIRMGNEAAKAQTGEMAMQLDHQTTLADAVREQFEYAQKIAEAQRNGNDALVAQLKTQKDLALALSAQRADEAKREKRGLTLGDLAKDGGTYGHRARQVNRLEQRADRLRGHGRIAESDALHNRADAARRGLERSGVLKPSEANKDMTAALDKSEVLKAIKTNTENLGKNR